MLPRESTRVVNRTPDFMYRDYGTIGPDNSDLSTRLMKDLVGSNIGQLYNQASELPIANFILPSTRGMLNFVDNNASLSDKAMGALEIVPLAGGLALKGGRQLGKLAKLARNYNEGKNFSKAVKTAHYIQDANLTNQIMAIKSNDFLNKKPVQYKPFSPRTFDDSEIGYIYNKEALPDMDFYNYVNVIDNKIRKTDHLGIDYDLNSNIAKSNLPSEYVENIRSSKKKLDDDYFSKKIDVNTRRSLGEINQMFHLHKNYLKQINELIPSAKNSYRLDNIKNLKNAIKERMKPVAPINDNVDWSLWNKEIPLNKSLMDEYKQIESESRSNGTWMLADSKTPFKADYSSSLFERTGMTKEQQAAAQFIQSKSKNYLKAYPNGVEQMYRGVHKFDPISINGKISAHNLDDVFTTKTGDRSIFGANRMLAKNYAGNNVIADVHGNANNSILSLLHPKSSSVEFNVNGSDWGRLPLRRSDDKLNKVSKIDNKKDGVYLTTNHVADFIERHDIGIAKLNNIDDGGRGSVKIMNNKLGQYVKSRIGNNGMFDLNDPNMLKAFVPTIPFLFNNDSTKH